MNPISKPDYMNVDELRALQLKKLQTLIPYEYERVPLFRRRCDEAGVKPRDLVELKDLAKFPFMKKTDLRDEYPFGLTAAPMSDINRFHCSSGTTGTASSRRRLDATSRRRSRSATAATGTTRSSCR